MSLTVLFILFTYFFSFLVFFLEWPVVPVTGNSSGPLGYLCCGFSGLHDLWGVWCWICLLGSGILGAGMAFGFLGMSIASRRAIGCCQSYGLGYGEEAIAVLLGSWVSSKTTLNICGKGLTWGSGYQHDLQ